MKLRGGFWRKGVTRERIAKGPTKGEYAKEFVKTGVPGVVYKVLKERPQGSLGIEFYLEVDFYQCKNCFHKNNHYTDFMTADVDPIKLTYILKFNNSKFAKFFFDYNPEKVVAQTVTR